MSQNTADDDNTQCCESKYLSGDFDSRLDKADDSDRAQVSPERRVESMRVHDCLMREYMRQLKILYTFTRERVAVRVLVFESSTKNCRGGRREKSDIGACRSIIFASCPDNSGNE
jgi:hypothetical protein